MKHVAVHVACAAELEDGPGSFWQSVPPSDPPSFAWGALSSARIIEAEPVESVDPRAEVSSANPYQLIPYHIVWPEDESDEDEGDVVVRMLHVVEDLPQAQDEPLTPLRSQHHYEGLSRPVRRIVSRKTLNVHIKTEYE